MHFHMHSRTKRSRRLRAQAGFTLIELMISLLIVGLIMGVAIPNIETITGVRARESAAKMVGMVRYMYNESAISGRPCRMTFDLDKHAYWAECTEGHFTITSERERSRDGHAVEEKKRDFTASSSSSAGFSIDDADAAKQERERIEKDAEFSEFTQGEMAKQQLPGGVDLSVWVDHQREKYKTGKSYLYFFPQGYTERAQIYLSTGDTVYTVKVSALTGKAKVEPKELDLPKDVF